MIRIRKGLDVPLAGAASGAIVDGPAVRTVAVLGDDFLGLRPKVLVTEGQQVAVGTPLVAHKGAEGVQLTAPGAGVVKAIVRGDKRKLEAVVIELGGDAAVPFEPAPPTTADGAVIKDRLLTSGLWTSLRTRPFSKVPSPDTTPAAIFVTAIDTRPLAVDPALVLADRKDDFEAGVVALSKLTTGKVFVCCKAGATIPVPKADRVSREDFDGPHPAGLVGTHIHYLLPAHPGRVVWHVGYQDVAAIGALLLRGVLDVSRVIALAGPAVQSPRFVRTRLGASLEDLTAGAITEPARIVSGSLLDGRTLAPHHAWLGRYHHQVSAVSDVVVRPLNGWLMPGFDKFSATRAFASSLTPGKLFPFSTQAMGDHRPIIPIGVFEKVMPLDLEPTHLLKAISVGDVENCEVLGAMELDEEDLALCSFVDPGKESFGPLLRSVLTSIEKEA